MKSEIQIDNNAGVCQIDIEGTIGVPEEWQFDRPEARVATYEKFRDAVRRIAEIDASEVVVNIRSTGGDVNDALLIHDALTALGAHITTRCYGYTASAATIIAQAASPGCREISANALYLIHTAVCATEGNAAELNGKLDLLRQTDAAYAESTNGRQGLAYHGIPLVDVRLGAYLADTSLHKSFCLLTDRRNLVLAVNTSDFPGNEVRMWYNPDLMENRQRAVFMAGCDVIDETMLSYAFRV